MSSNASITEILGINDNNLREFDTCNRRFTIQRLEKP